MWKSASATMVALGLVATGALVGYPALRAKLAQSYRQVTGWDRQAREADPAGFVTYAEGKLRRDLDAMRKTRRELVAEAATLARKQHEQQALADQARALAEQFRDAYQAAESGDGFPLVVRNAAYTADQVHSQVSMLLAEAEGYRESLDAIKSVQADAEQRIEGLVVRINATESQLATLATKREDYSTEPGESTWQRNDGFWPVWGREGITSAFVVRPSRLHRAGGTPAPQVVSSQPVCWLC